MAQLMVLFLAVWTYLGVATWVAWRWRAEILAALLRSLCEAAPERKGTRLTLLCLALLCAGCERGREKEIRLDRCEAALDQCIDEREVLRTHCDWNAKP